MNNMMDNKLKELRFVSLGMFALIALKIIDILQVLIDMEAMDTTGMDAAVLAARPLVSGLIIAVSAISIIVLAILGIKGLREANAPSSSRYHIILASVASVFFGFSFISEIVALFQGTNATGDVGPVLIAGLFVIDTVHYAMTAKALRVAK